MKGDAKVIEYLNRAIRSELTAVSQYWLHYRLQEDWGLGRMAKKSREESIEEMHHADRLITRVIFLEGHPNLQRLDPLRIGQTPRETLDADLAAELEAGALYREAREYCGTVGDFVTMKLFEELLADEEGHVDFLETQIALFDRLGAERYALLNALPADVRRRSLVLMAAVVGGAALAQGAGDLPLLGDPHLNTLPRTIKEAARIAAVTARATDFTTVQPFEGLPAGAATVRARTTADAFSDPSDNISFDRELDFKVGNGLFRKLWVSAPSSTLASDGLGPLYNARACQSCHIKDGRGHPPEGPGETAVSMFLRVSVPADLDPMMAEISDYLATAPDPVYGGQLQDFGTAGHPAEYRLDIHYEDVVVALSDGETATLRRPTYTAADLGYGPLHPDAMLSPRVAPQMIGLGLLEAIPAADILALADPDDADGNGISGRPNIVWSVEYGQPMLGRFGLKAGMPTIREQSAGAFSGDIGISTPLFPDLWGDCTAAQTGCRTAPHGGDAGQDGFEVDAQGLDLVTFYSRNLGVPARRNEGNTTVLRGKEVFYQTGCTGCHQPAFVTHRLADQPEQSFQLIWPYTDMLLHDMGKGLADNRPEARATGREWRTPPLWGIGLTEQVSGHATFLHDGRARNLLEAILWHGGEAQAARDRVVEMPAKDRAALIEFLESL